MSDKIKLVSLGADPELFLRDVATGEFVPATGLLGGSKDSPRPVNKGAVQEDNVLAEFNIVPATDARAFVDNIMTVREELNNMVRPYDLTTFVTSSHIFTHDALKEAGPMAFEFGCDPDFNAWLGGEVNPKPASTTDLRTAGGHVHFGLEGADLDINRFIRVCDATLGVVDVLTDPEGAARRALYGCAGAYRPKPYGVEYRTLSNAWLSDSDAIDRTYRLSEYAVSLYNSGFDPKPSIRQVINSGDRQAAHHVYAGLHLGRV